MEASDDEEPANWYDEDTESEEDETEAVAAFDFDDDDSVEPVPDPAALVDQDGNAIHQLSIDRFVAYLGGEDNEGKEDSHYFRDAVKSIYLWPEPSFDLVVQTARASQRARATLQPGLLANAVSAERASILVSSLPNLKQLKLQDDGLACDRRGRKEHRYTSYVEHFMRRLANRNSKLSFLEISVDCPKDPNLLLELLDSQGPRLESFTFACQTDRFLDRDVAYALSRGFGRMFRLRNLRLDLYANKDMPGSVIGLLLVGRLENVDVTFRFKEPNGRSDDDDTIAIDGDDDSDYFIAKAKQEVADSAIFQEAVENVAGIVRRSRNTLRKFILKCKGHLSGPKEGFDGIPLLEKLVGAEVLEEIALKSINLSASEVPANESGRRNTSIATVRLQQCEMGSAAFALLSGCAAITTMELNGCDGLPCYESWKTLLRGLRGLRTFSVVSCSTWSKCRVGDDSIVKAIVEDAPPTVTLLDLELDEHQKYRWEEGYERFTSIQQLILERTGNLKLKLRCPGDENLAHLCDGIKFTRTLSSLDLHLSLPVRLPHSVSVVLSSIARNVSLQRAALVFEARSQNFELLSCCAPLTAVIRDNSTLEFLALKMDCSDLPQKRYSEVLLPALVEGLEHNRTLRAIHFFENDRNPISSSLSRSLVKVLKRPGLRLKTIKGLSYESSEDKRSIEYLCTTRYARMVVECPAEYTPVLVPRILSTLTMDGPDCVRHFLTHMPRHFLEHVLPKRGIRRARGTPASTEL